MIDRFEIVGSSSPRPVAERIIFCDGTGGSLLHAESDLELSHWRPNCTPTEYWAGTSTEICFRFLDNPGVEPQTFPANEPITCRYRVWIHRGAPSAAEIQKVYETYRTSPR